MSDTLIKFLKKTSWFNQMPEDAVASLAGKTIARDFKKGDALMRKGELVDSVFVVRSGWVKIVIPDEETGGDVVLNHLGPGEFIGELSLLNNEPRSASVLALSPVEAVELKHKDLLELIDQFPQVGLYMISNMSGQMRYLVTYIEKSIQWTQKIAEGDYGFLEEDIRKTQQTMIIDNSRPDEARADRFLGAFFKMVEGVKQREELLIEKVYQLSIQIDESKRDAELESLTNSPFFQKLKSETRSRRDSRKKE